MYSKKQLTEMLNQVDQDDEKEVLTLLPGSPSKGKPAKKQKPNEKDPEETKKKAGEDPDPGSYFFYTYITLTSNVTCFTV